MSNMPLGATPLLDGIHFALFAPQTTCVCLVLRSPDHPDSNQTVILDKDQHLDSNGIWRIFIGEIESKMHYGYLIDGNWTIDPYARSLTTPSNWGEDRGQIFGKITDDSPLFSWEGVEKPGYQLEELLIYEMHIRGFTKDPSSQAKHPGTFQAVIEKIPYLKEIGINAVELLPTFSFDETRKNETQLGNYWGYSPESFFALMNPYGTKRDFQEMVKALHKAKIEVIVDVVYNHVGCGWLGNLSQSDYFITDQGQHTNYTGCGNTINTNSFMMTKLILDSLRYLTLEMGVDGFRFDLASIFCRGEQGQILEDPPVIRAICEDTAFASSKLIIEPWDAGGLYQVGTFPRKSHFAHWNGTFRDAVRRFIKGTDGAAGPFASAMAGACDFHSINFITAHDGFTLRDLVTYNVKHNEDNQEGGNDGTTCNESWNCGLEGPTEDPEISQLRTRQMKNFILALCFAQGTPMILMGDEYGHSRNGNNNSYCQDNRLNYFLWDQLEQNTHLFSFFKKCIALRKKCTLLNQKGCFTSDDITWHEPNWDSTSRFVAYVIHDLNQDMFLAFNASDDSLDTHMPLSRFQRPWNRTIDTNLKRQQETRVDASYRLSPRSGVLILS